MKRNEKVSQVGTRSAEKCENNDSVLVESTDELSRSKHMISNKTFDDHSIRDMSVEGRIRSPSLFAHRATYVEPNIYPSEIKISDLKYIQSIREEFIEMQKQLRKDIDTKFEELQKSMNGKEETQSSQ